jgi:hypothetical protein
MKSAEHVNGGVEFRGVARARAAKFKEPFFVGRTSAPCGSQALNGLTSPVAAPACSTRCPWERFALRSSLRNGRLGVTSAVLAACAALLMNDENVDCGEASCA